MCGITGIFAFNLIGKLHKVNVTAATMAIERRGPDCQDIHLEEWVALGHRRLSIIDTRDIANQPMWDDPKRYCIIFNGEIFNYKELRKELEGKGVNFFSDSDTEVLLKLYINEGAACLNKLNGFFAFCIYDRQEESLFLARDRFGVKPLLYQFDDDKFVFGSEMKSILAYGIDKKIDYSSLYLYLQLNYIPGSDSIFTGVKKLPPGSYMTVKKGSHEIKQYYSLPAQTSSISYDDAKEKLKTLLEESVRKRLVADVPLAAFLSGGIDSSVVCALAVKHKPDLHTFSIGYRDEKFFDETNYANLVAKKLQTKHTVFPLTNADLYSHLTSILDYIDEPFADSSAIAVNILSKETRKHATVALSGDGADEMLGGYNKHEAFYRMMHPGSSENLALMLAPLAKLFPQSRNSGFANKVRQLMKYREGKNMSPQDRYWRWATLADKDQAMNLLHPDLRTTFWLKDYVARRKDILSTIPDNASMNDIFRTDMRLVLPGDMLTKVDMMSMAHGLEVRTPFLDFEVVNFLFSLPDDFKIDKTIRKRILQDAFRDILPPQLYNRPKKGFEVPMLKWLRNEMKELINDDLLSQKNVEEQGIFFYPEVERLKQQLYSANPGDVHATIWGLVVFQYWYKKYFKATSNREA
ncbi:MAG TPA: asparagine synthase (glutamine-hydrolyzing) [Cyclobacteriaceae bacterium]|nr:asparagine synthase (glutamine-hydrolyzing) [Cyclobacteriaceae bacterium]